MKNWENLYKNKGIVQKKPFKTVVEAAKFFKERKLKKILDLGCGTGRHTTFLLKKGFKVYGCDSSKSALKIIKKLIPSVKFKECDMTRLPYQDNFFDGILCHQVIPHGKIKEIKKAIAEIYRVLKESGILYLAVISIKHDEYNTGEEIEPNTKINIDAIDGDVPHHYFTKEELKKLFSKFKIIKLDHIEYPSEKNPNKKSAAYILYGEKVGSSN